MSTWRLWRIAAIGMGVVLGTGAQLFLWPDDPIDKLRAGLARRLHLVRGLVDQAIAPPAAAPARPSAAMLTLGDLTTELQLLANAEVLHGYLRARHAEHTALILEVARLFTSALWAAETTPATTARVGLDAAVRARLQAISEESARLARALESRRGLLGSTGPTAIIPAEAGAGPAVAAQAPVLDGMERSLGRIAFLTGAPRPDGASRSGGQRMTELTPGMLRPIDVSEPTTSAPRRVARHRGAEDRAQGRARPRAVLPGDARARLAGPRDLRGHVRHHRADHGGCDPQQGRAPAGGRRARRRARPDRHRRLHAEPPRPHGVSRRSRRGLPRRGVDHGRRAADGVRGDPDGARPRHRAPQRVRADHRSGGRAGPGARHPARGRRHGRDRPDALAGAGAPRDASRAGPRPPADGDAGARRRPCAATAGSPITPRACAPRSTGCCRRRSPIGISREWRATPTRRRRARRAT